MRKLIITLVGIFSFIALGLICLMVVAVTRGNAWFTNGFHNLELVNEQTVALNDIQMISIEYDADDVEFFASNTNELVLKEYMNFTPDEDQLTQITQSRGRLKLEGQIWNDVNWFSNTNRRSRMEIYLPADYQGALDTSTSSGNITSDLLLKLTALRLSASSGDININEVTAAKIDLSTSSGNITISKAEGSREFKASSGSIEVYGGAGDTSATNSSGNITIESSTGLLEAEASSGNIVIKASSGEKILSTTSGNIKITDADGYTKASASSGTIKTDTLAGAGQFKTTSGDIRLNIAAEPEALTKDIIIATSSGAAELSIPSSLQFNFNADTSSGSINTSFEDILSFSDDEKHAKGTIGAAPSINIKIATSSGDIKVDQQ